MKIDWKKVLPHVVAICVFIGIAMAYFYPAMQGNMLKSHDIKMHKGMAKETIDHRADFGEEALWTNSAFGGMPATQITVVYNSNLIGKLHKVFMLGLPHPINYLFLYMMGFYIFLLCMKVDPWLSLVGAIAYGFSSYFFIIMGAGHNSKAVAVAYMAPALGGFLLAYRNKVFLGTAVMTLFMSLQINANHPQVTYYFFILLFFIFVYYIIKYIKDNAFSSLAKRTGLIALGTLLAISTNIPNLYGTAEYSPNTQRGGSELTPVKQLSQYANEIDTLVLNQLKLTGCDMPKCILEMPITEIAQKTGLDNETIDGVFKVLTQRGMKKDYALQWSYGKGETWNFMIPNAKGGASGALIGDEEFMTGEGNEELKEILQLNYQLYQSQVSNDIVSTYFGNQASTSGPVYIGAIVCLLFVLGMVFWRNNLKWPLLIMVILSIMLAWGKNFMWLTDIFWDHVPVYNKFRAVTIILVIVELILPIVGFLWLKDVVKNRETFHGTMMIFGKKEIEAKKLFLGVSGFVVFVTLLFAAMPGSLVDLRSDKDVSIFGAGNVSKQITAMVMSNSEQSVPQNYNGEPEQYAMEVTQHYMPKLEQAEKQLIVFRASVVQKDAFRSLIFILLAIGLLYFFIYKEMKPVYFTIALGSLILIDLWGVGLRYLDNEPGQNTEYGRWEKSEEKLIPFTPTYSDIAIMVNEITENPELGQEIELFIQEKTAEKNEALTYREDASKRFSKLNRMTNYRVLLLGDYSQETSISYFHKSLGGYHAAKIQRYQDLIERKMRGQMQLASNPNTLGQATILNMLNTKYIIANKNGEGVYIDMNNPATLSQENQQTTPGFINSEAFGNAWFVSEVKVFNSPDEEFAALDSENLESVAITDETFSDDNGKLFNEGIYGTYTNNGNETVIMTSYRPNEIKYSLDNITGGEHFIVFSEVYYALGWKAYVDGVVTPINRVDYTLRGLKVPEGSKEVILKYELKSFESLSNIALASSSLIILLVFGFGYLSIVKGKDD
jgi:hypothetical protein